MNDKLIIEKQAELIKLMEQEIQCIPTTVRLKSVSIELQNKILKSMSELALLEQNKGKEEALLSDTDRTIIIGLIAQNMGYVEQSRVVKSGDDIFNWINKKFDHSASPTMSKPSDYDIENAANEYAEENQHQRRSSYGKLHKAYTEGARNMRDNNIYISPNSKSEE